MNAVSRVGIDVGTAKCMCHHDYPPTDHENGDDTLLPTLTFTCRHPFSRYSLHYRNAIIISPRQLVLHILGESV